MTVVEAPAPPRRLGIWIVIAGTAVALAGFDALSTWSPVPARGLDGTAAPFYGRYEPVAGPWALAALGAAAALATTAAVLMRRETMRPRTLLTVSVLAVFGFACFIALARGHAGDIAGRTFTPEPPEYQADVPFVRILGVRNFVQSYPELVPELRSHANTHPPGPLVGLAMLESAFPNHVVPRALVVGLLGALVPLPLWWLASELAGAGAARIAVLVFLGVPGAVIFAFTSLDAVFATLLVLVAAALVRSARKPQRLGAAAGAGALAGAALFFTYAVSFVAVFGALYAFATSPARRAVRVVAGQAVGGIAVLVLLRLALGFDVFASYDAFRADFAPTPFQLLRPHGYWIAGNVAVWLTYAGISVSGLGLGELLARRPRFLLALLVPVLIFYTLPMGMTNLLPAETERTWLFLTPFLAVAAASRLGRSTPGPRLIGGLVFLAAVQAVVLRLLFVNLY